MLRFLVADDHSICRRGIREIIQEAYPDAEVEEVADAESLLQKVSRNPFDMVVTDLSMPGRNGLDALQQLQQLAPQLPVIVLSIYPEEQYAMRVFKNGAKGYLNKETATDELINAIGQVLSGKRYITQKAAESMFTALEKSSDKPPHHLLSDREFEVLKLIAGGKTTSAIARQLFLSETTVSTYRSRILEKLNLRTTADLVRYAVEAQLIHPTL